MAKEGKQTGAQGKLTYEQLFKAAKDLDAQNTYLKEQCSKLIQEVQKLSDFSMFKRLDYLFEVVKSSDKFPAEFVSACVDEIVATMTLPPAEENPAETKSETKEE